MARISGRRRRLPRSFVVSLSAVELCVLNAERLLVDATKVSLPTSAALAELSIEEAAKGWMLYFRLLAQGRRTRIRIGVTSRELKAASDFLESRADYLRGLDGEIIDAFKFHKVKLRFAAFLLQYLELALPSLAKEGGLLKAAQALHGPAFNVETLGTDDLDGIMKLLRSFRKGQLTELDSIKQRGLYVNLADSRDLVSPDLEPLSAQLLLALSAFLIVALKGDLLLLTK